MTLQEEWFRENPHVRNKAKYILPAVPLVEEEIEKKFHDRFEVWFYGWIESRNVFVAVFSAFINNEI